MSTEVFKKCIYNVYVSIYNYKTSTLCLYSATKTMCYMTANDCTYFHSFSAEQKFIVIELSKHMWVTVLLNIYMHVEHSRCITVICRRITKNILY